MVDQRSNQLILEFSPAVWSELMFFAKEMSPNEVGGLGEVAVDGGGRMRVTKLHLLKQDVSWASTDISPTQVQEFFSKWMLTAPVDGPLLKVWWHSHGTSDVFWSGQDELACNELQRSAEWFLAVVVNAEGKSLARLDGVHAEFGRFTVPVTIQVAGTLSEVRKAELREELKKLVKVVPVKEDSSGPLFTGKRQRASEQSLVFPTAERTCEECVLYEKRDLSFGQCLALGDEVMATSGACSRFIGGSKSTS